jgi:DNA-binding beta-propeller fold protein YncE
VIHRIAVIIGLAVAIAAVAPAGAPAADCSGEPSCPYRSAGVLGADPPTGHGVFRFPQGIAFSPGGAYVFVADQYSGIVQKFDRAGNWVSQLGWYADARQPGRLGTVGGLATDLAHHLYVLDSENDRIQVFASDTGAWLGAWGSTGTGAGRFQLGQNTGSGGIAVLQTDPGAAPVVFVADQLNHRIQRFTLGQAASADPGHPVLPAGGRQAGNPDVVPVPSPDAMWGSFGDCSPHGCGQTGDRFSLNFPQGVAVNPRADGAGRTLVYVADDDNHRVVVYTAGGAYVSELGGFGTGPGQFRYPYDVGLDSGNVLYVADNNNHRIHKFDGFSFSFLGMWGGFGAGPGTLEFPRALAALADDPLGGVYVADTANNRVQGFSSAGAATASWGIAGRGPRYVTRPGAVAVDGSGAVYIADTWAHRVQKLAPDGSYLGQWGYISARSGFAAPNIFDGQFQFPTGIAYDPRLDQVWVADTDNNRVQAFTSGGAWIATFGGQAPGSAPGQFDRPAAVAVGPAGDVFVADRGNDRIQKRDAGTGAWTTVSAQGHPLDAPSAVAAGEGGLYVADAGGVTRITATAADRVDGPAPGFAGPGGLWLTGQHLYVSDTGNNRVVRQDLRSGQWTTFGDEGNGAGTFLGPLGLATDPGESVLYVADQLNNRVERFSMSGPAVSGAVAPAVPGGKTPATPFRLRVTVAGRSLRRAMVRLAVRCSQRCGLKVTGSLLIPGARKRAKLPRLSRRLGANAVRILRLHAPASTRRLLRRATSRRTPVVRLSLVAVNATGKRVTRSLKVRLR